MHFVDGNVKYILCYFLILKNLSQYRTVRRCPRFCPELPRTSGESRTCRPLLFFNLLHKNNDYFKKIYVRFYQFIEL